MGVSSENLANIQKMSQQEILEKQKELMELLGKGRCDFLKNRGAQKMGRGGDGSADTAQGQAKNENSGTGTTESGGDSALGKSVSDTNQLLGLQRAWS